MRSRTLHCGLNPDLGLRLAHALAKEIGIALEILGRCERYRIHTVLQYQIVEKEPRILLTIELPTTATLHLRRRLSSAVHPHSSERTGRFDEGKRISCAECQRIPLPTLRANEWAAFGLHENGYLVSYWKEKSGRRGSNPRRPAWEIGCRLKTKNNGVHGILF